jgi:DNA-binding YbaB/EbfC family protein
MGLGNIQKMMKQVQKMQADLARVQEEAEQKVVEATSGGGAVMVQANGKGELVSVKVEPSAVDPSDVEILEDMIVAAANEALRQAKELVAAEMAKVTQSAGLPNIPGLPGLF